MEERNREEMPQSDRPPTSLLLVEDNDVEREGLATILRREGFVISEALNGQQALGKLRTETPNLILLDMLLSKSREDGWWLLGQLRGNACWSGIPILIITGLGVASTEWAQALGAVDVVRKPIQTDLLLEKLRAILT
jgi:CheY-like chemotaxis protein